MNPPSSPSRRQWINSSLVTCGDLVLARSVGGLAPKGYSRPGPIIDRERAPGMQAALVAENPGGEKTYAVIFAKGDEVLSGLTEFAEREKITANHFTAIGALQRARFGWLDMERKAYQNIPVNQQVELISFLGDVGLVNGAPQIQVHGAVGLMDGLVRGGHLLQAIAWPTVEVFFTACPTTLIKRHHDETNLFLFDTRS